MVIPHAVRKMDASSCYINVRYHFIRHHVNSGEIKIDWISTAEQQADIMTKALGPQVYLPLRDKIMGLTS